MRAACQKCWEEFEVGKEGGFFLGYGLELIEVLPKSVWDEDRVRRKKLTSLDIRSAFGNYIMKCYKCLQDGKKGSTASKKTKRVK